MSSRCPSGRLLWRDHRAGGIPRPGWVRGAGRTHFFWPTLTLFVLALVTAWSLVINGVVRIVDSVATRARELWWFGLLAGVVELGLGLWAISSPGRELLLLVNLIGIYVIIAGVDAIVVALTAERSGERAQAGAGQAR